MKTSVYLKPMKGDEKEQRSSVCFRVRDKDIDIKVVSELTVVDKYWNAEQMCYKRTTAISKDERTRIVSLLNSIIEEIEKTFDSQTANSVWLRELISDTIHPEKAYERRHPNLFKRMEEYKAQYGGTKQSLENIVSFEARLIRYQTYRQEILKDLDGPLFAEKITLDDMVDFRDYTANEHLLREEHPEFYARFAKKKYKHKELSQTTIIDTMNQYCMFLHWCKKMGYTESMVFQQYGLKAARHGDPFFLTREERNILYDADLTEFPHLSLIRDVFVFQCYIGCRVGDLFKMSRANIKDGFVEYIQEKTKKFEARTVRVPLHEKAARILERYDKSARHLFPLRELGIYNKGIKELLRHCGIDRMVTILDTHGYKTTQKPLYEVATSHTARKTFIGNLYKQVQDPNLIASMSGHAEGSTAFRRYRTIDDDMKRKLVDMIN